MFLTCVASDYTTHQLRSGCSRLVHHMDTTTSILGEMEASNAPRINRKIARPVKEVKADMIQRLDPQPKNCGVRSVRAIRTSDQKTHAETDPLVYGKLDQGVDRDLKQ